LISKVTSLICHLQHGYDQKGQRLVVFSRERVNKNYHECRQSVLGFAWLSKVTENHMIIRFSD